MALATRIREVAEDGATEDRSLEVGLQVAYPDFLAQICLMDYLRDGAPFLLRAPSGPVGGVLARLAGCRREFYPWLRRGAAAS